VRCEQVQRRDRFSVRDRQQQRPLALAHGEWRRLLHATHAAEHLTWWRLASKRAQRAVRMRRQQCQRLGTARLRVQAGQGLALAQRRVAGMGSVAMLQRATVTGVLCTPLSRAPPDSHLDTVSA